jgi:hypothetical protein
VIAERADRPKNRAMNSFRNYTSSITWAHLCAVHMQALGFVTSPAGAAVRCAAPDETPSSETARASCAGNEGPVVGACRGSSAGV